MYNPWGKIIDCIKYDKEEKKLFETKCLKCGSNDVSIREEIDYDWEENPYVNGYYLECNNCGNTDGR